MARRKGSRSSVEPSVTEQAANPAPSRFDRQSAALAALLTSLVWLALVGGAVLVWRQPQPAAFQIQSPPATATPAPTATSKPMRVQVAGAVLAPGLFDMPAGARAGDAIAAAGGLAADADAAAINLARPLVDGEKLTAPTIRPARPGETASDSASPDLSDTRSGGLDLGGSILIDINAASAPELEALPAIGPVTAQAIVDYRMANGPFRSVEDIVFVKGIGPATLDKIRDLITTGQ